MRGRRWYSRNHTRARVVPECYKDDVQGQQKTWNSTPAIRKRLNRWLPKCAWVIMSQMPTATQNFITIRLGNFASHVCEITYRVFTQLLFGFWQLATPRPLRRFWRSIRQKTFRARMCLLGFRKLNFTFWSHISPKRKFSVDFRTTGLRKFRLETGFNMRDFISKHH